MQWTRCTFVSKGGGPTRPGADIGQSMILLGPVTTLMGQTGIGPGRTLERILSVGASASSCTDPNGRDDPAPGLDAGLSGHLAEHRSDAADGVAAVLDARRAIQFHEVEGRCAFGG